MASHQILIGGVALTLGLVSLSAALINYEPFFKLAKMRLLEGLLGRWGARLVCALLGCSLLLISGLIFAGILPRR